MIQYTKYRVGGRFGSIYCYKYGPNFLDRIGIDIWLQFLEPCNYYIYSRKGLILYKDSDEETNKQILQL